MHSPFLDPDNPQLAAMLADAAVILLADRGIDGLSSRAMAHWLGVTGPALTQQAGRADQVRSLLAAFGGRWLDWSRPRFSEELPARLPDTADERHGVRVWNALGELARSEFVRGNGVPATLIAEIHREEGDQIRGALQRLVDPGVDELEAAYTTALVRGLRTDVVALEGALDVERANRILRRHVDLMRARQPVRSA